MNLRPAFFLSVVLCVDTALASPQLSLVPQPAKVVVGEGKFQLNAATSLIAEKPAEKHAAEMLASWLRPSTGLPLPLKSSPVDKAIRFSLDPQLDATLGREGYQLDSGPGGVTIRAAAEAGLFYGAQTFRQLLPPQAFRATKAGKVSWVAPALKIQDKPRLVWRGFMLDVSRHFFPIDYVESLIDDMASQKLNLLQLHLTDDDGWRIEIKTYPKLTEVGAWRGTDCPLPNTRKGETFARYGGFYTQDQLKHLVAYAKERNIEIMPEIDLPGHALAIATAYPETLPGGVSEAVSAQGHKANAISPAKETNYRMIDDIIAEVAAIFPFSYIHIGGDEVNHKVWETCPEIKELMVREKLGNLHEAQVYFTRRLEGILAKHDKKMIGWQEISNDKLSKETAIMAWIGPGPGWNAAKRGAPAVLAPGGSFYFDMGCPGGEDEPPSHWWAGKVSLDRAYEFDPISPQAGLDDAAKAKILGVQAALWTEFVIGWNSKSGWLTLKDEADCANYKIWPRLCATAETAWTPQTLRKFDGFMDRMGGQFMRMAESGQRFRLELPSATLEKGLITIHPPAPGIKVRYTTDGSDPFDSGTAKLWDAKPIDGRFRNSLAMRAVMPDYKILSPLTRGATIAPAGTWKVAGWAKGEGKTLVFPVSGQIHEAGRWRVRLAKTQGSDGLQIDSMELRSAPDKVISSATPKRGNSVILETKDPVSKNLELVVKARFTGDKPNAEGNVLIEMLTAEVIPGMKVETKIPGYGADHSPEQLLDGDPETFFWSSRNIEAEETLTWLLPEAIAMKSIELQSGQINSTKDQLLDAVLEVSTDGETFRKASGFTYGTAKAELGGKPIIAIRVRATAKSPGWVILQDLVIRRS